MGSKIFSITIIIFCAQLVRASGYFYQDQKGVKQEAKAYDAIGACQEHPKSFDVAMNVLKNQKEAGSTQREKTICKIINDKKILNCEFFFMGELYSKATTYWHETEDSCEKARKANAQSKSNDQKIKKSYSLFFLDYKNQDGYGSVIGASKSCFYLKVNKPEIKKQIEGIAKKEGFLNNKECVEDAFPSSYSCKKDHSFSRSYRFFENNEECTSKLESIRSNYNLK